MQPMIVDELDDLDDLREMEDIQGIAVIGGLRAFPQADHYNPFEALSDAKFFESFRFTKRACVDVLREVLPHLPPRVSRAGGVQPFMRDREPPEVPYGTLRKVRKEACQEAFCEIALC
ncbi:hypothetical protein FOZ63_006147 [Perkinsus olseni]|uniref:Uncharacterized protein n=1 Tax=Perkinsus olseni TaxID=32597 RepID=A0A7J6R8P6_PEROL|nr:hypothetical protein FOZ63_006147 [Perkinsus olseni]